MVILERPITIFQGQQSKWNAGFNPVNYKFEGINTYGGAYNILIEVYEFGSDKLLGIQRVKPILVVDSFTYQITVNIASVLHPYLINKYSYTSNNINQKDKGSSLRFYIKYYDRSYDELISTNSDESNPIFITASANQTGYTYGSNMAEYVLYGNNVTPKAKFLTAFKEPIYYIGYPFSISFIYSDNVSGISIIKHEDELNLNKAEVFESETDLDTSQVRGVNHLKLKPSYDANTKFVNVYLKTGIAVSDTYVDNGYVDLGYTV